MDREEKQEPYKAADPRRLEEQRAKAEAQRRKWLAIARGEKPFPERDKEEREDGRH